MKKERNRKTTLLQTIQVNRVIKQMARRIANLVLKLLLKETVKTPIRLRLKVRIKIQVLSNQPKRNRSLLDDCRNPSGDIFI